MELRAVDEAAERLAPVFRLESKETQQREKPLRLAVPEDTIVSHRLDLPAQEEFETRTYQPGIEVLIDVETINPNATEQDWGTESTHHRHIPWGWFALLGILLAGGAIWSLTQIQEADTQAGQIQVAAQNVLDHDAQEDLQAGLLIDRIEAVTREFFKATQVEDLARHVRQVERVRPLIHQYHAGKPIPANPVVRTKLLQPLTLENRANFWLQSVELQNRQTRNLIIEVGDSGEPKIDWETLVCYQPMAWGDFATQRPAGVSLDFRIYLEPDNFFSHEFADSSRWNCFRLTALDSEETLFGYAKAGESVAADLLAVLQQNQGRRTSVILRVSIPEGLQSRRGLMIEKLLSPRWIYLDPPDA